MHDGHNLTAEWPRRCVILKGLNQPTYPPQIPHALPPSGPQMRPLLLFLKCSQISLCRTLDDLVSWRCFDGSLFSFFCRAANSEGGIGLAIVHNPFTATLTILRVAEFSANRFVTPSMIMKHCPAVGISYLDLSRSVMEGTNPLEARVNHFSMRYLLPSKFPQSQG